MLLTFKNFYTEADKNGYDTPIIALKNWVVNHPTVIHYLRNIPKEEQATEIDNTVNHLHSVFGNKINFGLPASISPDDIRSINLEINRKFPKFVKPHELEKIPEHIPSTSIGGQNLEFPSSIKYIGRTIPKDIEQQNSSIGTGGNTYLTTTALQGRTIPKDVELQNTSTGTGGKMHLTTQNLPPFDRNTSEIDQIVKKEPSPRKTNLAKEKEKSQTLRDEIKKAIQRANELGVSDPNFLPPGEHPDDHKIAKKRSREKVQSQFDREGGTHLA
jgi:hypothetical protein